MQCPECGATHIRKNGKKKGKQNHICVACGRQFINADEPQRGYSAWVARSLALYSPELASRGMATHGILGITAV